MEGSDAVDPDPELGSRYLQGKSGAKTQTVLIYCLQANIASPCETKTYFEEEGVTRSDARRTKVLVGRYHLFMMVQSNGSQIYLLELDPSLWKERCIISQLKPILNRTRRKCAGYFEEDQDETTPPRIPMFE